MIILDPPKFAPTAAHAEKAARAYKDINLLAFKLLRPAGYWSRSRARAESTQGCSKRSWRDQPSTQASTRRSSNIYRRMQIIPSRCISRRSLSQRAGVFEKVR
jgi:23S rRNA G2069 N7-methylase RlmK/C1962 C5-methylase RlmI